MRLPSPRTIPVCGRSCHPVARRLKTRRSRLEKGMLHLADLQVVIRRLGVLYKLLLENLLPDQSLNHLLVCLQCVGPKEVLIKMPLALLVRSLAGPGEAVHRTLRILFKMPPKILQKLFLYNRFALRQSKL